MRSFSSASVLSSSSSSSFPLLLLALVASLLFTPTHQSSDLNTSSNGDFIDQICRKTPFYDLCIATLHSNPLTRKPDLKGAALVMVNNLLANTSDTLNYIEGLIKQTSDQQLEQALAFCAESYIPIVKYTLPQAADAVSQGRFGFASYCISDAAKEINNCDKRFSGSAQNKSLLGDRNGVLQKLVGVASAIMKLLLKG
ncbi:cell wall / vacuolar inhibitor of fructosidase 1-like [Neltuma alba]|uniref:cell wall / vacuolar inhibitor of fructosidase 1-like n=1 Tax=Neltuma alba TaxID=207710 RepID=UPI0010A2EB79|nr:cell wall / vacuolar inhibitor of fructosidase 1-like [Prosopis alba]XP_028760143.1 cell wall / vacuolar inhibitor of fructosidase 1-like [Prosopis alba]